MAQFQGKRTDSGIPIHVQTERYTEGESSASLEGSVCLGEKPGNTVFPLQLDADGYLKVVDTGGGSSGHEYQDGESNFGAYGHLILGDDGSNLQTISVDSSGRLQVEVVEGGYDGVQYEDGAAVGSPFGTVAFGHDGSNVYPVKVDSDGRLRVVPLGYDGATEHPLSVDSSGRLQVEVVEGQYTGIQYTSGDSDLSPTGTVALGHDGSEVYPVKVDSNGRLQVEVVEGQYDGVQYDSGENEPYPVGTAVFGHNGSNVYPIKVDSSGYLQVDIHDSPKATVLNVSSDVSLAAGTTTQIVGADADRLCIIIANLATNTQTFRIGNASTSASTGIELAPGESIEIETTAAVYGYNPGGSAESVSVMWTEE